MTIRDFEIKLHGSESEILLRENVRNFYIKLQIKIKITAGCYPNSNSDFEFLNERHLFYNYSILIRNFSYKIYISSGY